jgi:hypothetical protein
VRTCPVVVLGDFNIHVEQLCEALVSQSISILERFDMQQLVDCSTHRLHGVIDLVIKQCTPIVLLQWLIFENTCYLIIMLFMAV